MITRITDTTRRHMQNLFDAKRRAWEAARIRRESSVPSVQEFAKTLEDVYNKMAHEEYKKIKKEESCRE